MPNPSITYTFANSTTADATQVNQNFTDIINGLTDGTKDLTINALTCAGATTLNGHVTLGNGSPDDITFTGSLASSIPIKTTDSYDIGSSTLALRSIYLGSSGGAFSTRLKGAAVSSSYTLTTPTTGGTVDYVARTDGSGTLSFVPQYKSPNDITNYSITTAVGSSALTITMKGADGNDLSATNPAFFVFRSSTATSGAYVERKITSNLTLVISSGSTLGHLNSTDSYMYLYAIDNAGTVELAVSSTMHDTLSLQSTTAEGGSGGADSWTGFYSATARTDVAIRLIARLKSNLGTAGTWSAVPTEASLINNDTLGQVVTGTYTPTHAVVANVDVITAATNMYIRINRLVMVFGQVTVDPGAISSLSYGISLPIPTDITATASVSGTCTSGNQVHNGRVIGDATNNRANVDMNATASAASDLHTYSFMYILA